MSNFATKDLIFDEDDSDSIRTAIRFGQVKRVDKILDGRHFKVDILGGIFHYAISCNQVEIARLLISKYECPVDYKNNNKEIPLHIACKKGHRNVVKLLVSEYESDLNARDKNNNTPLNTAAFSGRTDVVKCLIEEFSCSLNTKGFKGRTVLHQACFKGHTQLAEALLTHYKADPTLFDDDGLTVLHYAAFKGMDEVIRLLITKFKCAVDCRNNINYTALHYACYYGHLSTVRMLTSEYKADLNACNKDNDTPLHKAAFSGHTDIVRYLIDEFGCSPSIKGFKGRTVLHQACIKGHTELTEVLLTQYKADPSSFGDDGNTVLHYAALKGMSELVKLLITKLKCAVDCRNNGNYTPLHYACSNGHLNTVRMLVSECKADLNARDKNNNTPLNKAALGGHTVVLQCLIDEFGCSPNTKGLGGRTVLHQACIEGHTLLAKALLTQYKANPAYVDDSGDSVLHCAVLKGMDEIAKLLITKFRCVVDCRNNNNITPLHYACRNGYLSTVKMLACEYKADLNACDKKNDTPLHKAAFSGNTDIVKCLIDKFGCDPNMRGFKSRTVLHQACRNGHLSTVTMLVSEYKADLNARDEEKDTPLNKAALGGHADVVKCLVNEFDCNPNTIGFEGRTVLHQACFQKHPQLVKLLLIECRANPTSFDYDGDTVLHYAALKGMDEIVKLLITKFKCAVDCRNNINCTPLHYACRNGHLRTVRILVSEYKAGLNARDDGNDTPLHKAALGGHTDVVKCLINEFGCNPNTKGFKGRAVLHQACNLGQLELTKSLLTHFKLDPSSVDDNGNTPIHLAALSGNKDIASLLITKYKCPVDIKNSNNQTPLDIAIANTHVNIVNLICKGNTNDYNRDCKVITESSEVLRQSNRLSGDKDAQACQGESPKLKLDSSYLPLIPREGYVCMAQSSVCIVQLPSDTKINVQVHNIDDITLHPQLRAKEFKLTPVVRISSDTKVLSPDKQAVIEILKTAELTKTENKPIPIFSDFHSTQPPQWKDLNPDDFEVLRDRVVFNTTHFSLFTVIVRLPTPNWSVMVNPSEQDQNPIELTLSEVSNLKVVIPPSSIKSESEIEIKITADFDHPLLCEESTDASACITLEPHGLQFKEKIPVVIPIPDYARMTETYSEAKLQFLQSNDSLDSTSINWTVIPEGEYQIKREGDHYVGIVFTTHFSHRKAKWLGIPKTLKKVIQGPIREFRKYVAKKLLRSFSGQCQVFMSSETRVGNILNFSIAAILHPYQEFHKTPWNYDYMLYDSEQTRVTVKGSRLKLTLALADNCIPECGSKDTSFCEEVELSGDFSARADFNIRLDSSTTLVDGAVLAELSIHQGEIKSHTMNLIKPKKVPENLLSDASEKYFTEETSLVKEALSKDEKYLTITKAAVVVHLPSLDSVDLLGIKDFHTVWTRLWRARLMWLRIGISLKIDIITLVVIAKDNWRTDDCFEYMLKTWLNCMEPFPCWKHLAMALQSIGINVLLETPVVCPSTESEPSSSLEIGLDENQSSSPKKRTPVPLPRKKAPVPLPRKKALTPHPEQQTLASLPKKKPSVPLPKRVSRTPPKIISLAKRAITNAVHQLNTSLNQWESNTVTELAEKIANCVEQMAVYVREDHQDTRKHRQEFAFLAGNIVSESEQLVTMGNVVAEACTEETLKKALQQENLPKIEPITKQFKLLKKVAESSQEQGDATCILVDNAENLLSAVKQVVDDIQVATIAIKDHSVHEKLGLRWVKRDIHTVKKFGPTFTPENNST